jgi:tRNA(fMet)-specific endonuclease VapC
LTDRKGSKRLHELIDAFVTAVEVAPFDDLAATAFGRIGSVLAGRGTPIGEMNALIAGHAVALRRTLVTNNVRHFRRVPGLSVENWR